MFTYIRQHTLIPPTELKQKRRRQKLKTFTKARDSTKKMNTKLNQATLLLSSAYKSLLNPTKGYKQGHTYKCFHKLTNIRTPFPHVIIIS